VDRYLTEIREATTTLVREFALREVSAEAGERRASIRFANQSAASGVEFKIDWADLKVFVTVCRLTTKGEFAGLHSSTRPGNEPRSAFNADDLLLLRDPNSKLPNRRLRRKAPGEARPILDAYVHGLREHAADVLRGDFGVFEALNTVVEERTARLRHLRGRVTG
jgi:hypothetical protein